MIVVIEAKMLPASRFGIQRRKTNDPRPKLKINKPMRI
jgi:hypothetical protein